jgi:N-methylhydantoinase A/oxoprolinase/acetone carboxylase beta subunit
MRITVKDKYSIGMDIGGTHTDVVLIDRNQKIVAYFKTETTIPLENGVKRALKQLLEVADVDRSLIEGVYVGTTHATNAILEARDLHRVGVIRIAGHRPELLSPCFGWPTFLKEAVLAGVETISGGFECDLREISPFRPHEAVEAANKLAEKGMESLAVVAVFSPIEPRHEIECLNALKEAYGEDFPISLSHQVGGMGFIERENAAILNAALKRPMEQGFRNLEKVVAELGLEVPLYITQNDGSLIGLDKAVETPLLTISSGPTNSFIGACKLSGSSNAIIVDVGGTSTDIGMVVNGYPRRSMHNATIGGVCLNFRMPDVLALAIGGGSKIAADGTGQFLVGPQSCGKMLRSSAQIFGGKQLTLTDIACVLGKMDVDGSVLSQVQITKEQALKIMEDIERRIVSGIARMKGERADLPVIAVGGGAGIAASAATDLPSNYSVANAYGAALAEIAATVDTVVSLTAREQVLQELQERAIEEAVRKGAHSRTTRIVELQIIPYHYLPNHLARVVVSASGCRI